MKGLRIFLLLIAGTAALAFARTGAKSSGAATVTAAISSTEFNEQWMVEGEKRYRANCGRCHQAPRKFPPRAMATAIRHMRVRAMLTEDDMKYVTYYMTH
jgi:cytochrome c5